MLRPVKVSLAAPASPAAQREHWRFNSPAPSGAAPREPAIQVDDLAVDEARFVRYKKREHIGKAFYLAFPPDSLLLDHKLRDLLGRRSRRPGMFHESRCLHNCRSNRIHGEGADIRVRNVSACSLTQDLAGITRQTRAGYPYVA
jgi:hypothetical protein